MAETLVSPGVLARENDQSFITQQPVQAGAAIVGPTVKGPVEQPTIVTSYSDYQNRFGTTFESGSNEYSFFTSITAANYFNNGGNTLLVTRVVNSPSTWNYASASIQSSEAEGGALEIAADNLLSSITTNPTNAGAATYTSVATTTSGNGSGAVATVVVTGTTAPTITGITVTSAGADYAIGDTVTIAAGALGTGQLITGDNVLAITAGTYDLGVVTGPFTVAQSSTSGAGTGASFEITGDGVNTISAITVSSIGTGHADTDVISITAADLLAAGFTGATGTVEITLTSAEVQDSDAAVITLDADNIDNATAFELETLDKGVIGNNVGTVLAQNAMESGSSDNVRWEIATSNTSSGTFSLLIRRGNDTQNNKVVLESWNNLSLDPTQDNFITKVIGDEKYNYQSSGNYLQVSGSYPNASRYVRVKSVNQLTPNYLDNAGNAKSQFTGFIPTVGSGSYNGSFAGGVGNVVPSSRTMNLYQNINATDSQGLVGSDYTSMLNLLSNQDNYQFNALFLPGLTNADHTSQITTAINNTQQRGDNILIIDPDGYATSITETVNQASSRNTSYAAMYWPWLQVIDPDLGDRVWVPASTMIAGVYAYNDSVSEPWFAPAGINRGGLTNVVRAERQLPAADRDTLYESNVNPIATFPGTGVVVYGQKTLQRQASALDRVNVRRLLIALKSYIGQVAQTLVFEQNTAATRNNFLAAVNPYLESVQQRQGLYAFKVVMDDSNNTPDVIDRNQLVGAIYLQPTRTAEFIYLDFNVLPTGATFPS